MSLNIQCELEQFPETSNYIQRVIKKGVRIEPQLSWMLNCYLEDQKKRQSSTLLPLIEELTFLLGFYSRKHMYLMVA